MQEFKKRTVEYRFLMLFPRYCSVWYCCRGTRILLDTDISTTFTCTCFGLLSISVWIRMRQLYDKCARLVCPAFPVYSYGAWNILKFKFQAPCYVVPAWMLIRACLSFLLVMFSLPLRCATMMLNRSREKCLWPKLFFINFNVDNRS